MTKEEKKALMQQWKKQQNKKYVLSKTRATKLFHFLDKQLEEQACDNTLHFTRQWLSENVPQEKHNAILSEIEEMGGHCDCEVLMNCYEKYDIEI